MTGQTHLGVKEQIIRGKKTKLVYFLKTKSNFLKTHEQITLAGLAWWGSSLWNELHLAESERRMLVVKSAGGGLSKERTERGPKVKYASFIPGTVSGIFTGWMRRRHTPV